MLKSKLQVPTQPIEAKYPFLARYNRADMYVILVTGPGRFPSTSTKVSDNLWSGVVIHTNSASSHQIGKTSEAWAKDAFDVLPEGSTVTLSV